MSGEQHGVVIRAEQKSVGLQKNRECTCFNFPLLRNDVTACSVIQTHNFKIRHFASLHLSLYLSFPLTFFFILHACVCAHCSRAANEFGVRGHANFVGEN